MEVGRTLFNPHVQNKWPASRGLSTYNEMTGLNLEEEMQNGGIWIDIGPGQKCAAISELSEKIDNVWVIGIAPNVPEEFPVRSTIFGGWMPTLSLPIDGRARVVTDIFSGVSYAPHGLNVLIKAASWLAPGGVVAACTETRRLGDGWTHDRIVRFFKECMALECKFQVYKKFAEGNQKWEDQLRIVIRNNNTYDSLIGRANKIVGRALRGRLLWQSKDEAAKIFEVTHHDPKYFERNYKQIQNESYRYETSITSASPAWPQRDLKAYNEMVGFDIQDYLKDGQIYIDSGCGLECRALGEIARHNPKVTCVGVSMNVPDVIPMGITVIPRSLPNYDFKYIAPAHLITDIYGAVSFADKKILLEDLPYAQDKVKESDSERKQEYFEPAALETLVRLASQLASNGKLVVCTELDRFGDEYSHKRITHFFKKEMGLKCRFEEYQHFAEDRQIEETQLRIVIDSDRDYEGLIGKAEKMVGIAHEGRTLWESKEDEPEKRMRIMEMIFEKEVGQE